MKNIFAFLMLLGCGLFAVGTLGSTASAESVLILNPGSSGQIVVGEVTRVECSANAVAKCSCKRLNVSGKFCARYYDYKSDEFFCAGPGTTAASFENEEDCQLALPSIPVCI